ncbi:MAG: hypothetical protein JKY70_03405 [Mucilaginibacter sp.]|nr:hypothetical protein [Mucilaginibacter sp.]
MSDVRGDIRNIDYVHMCLHLAFDSLNELSILSKERSADEVNFIHHSPLIKYAVALQYMFVMEYTKLFEVKKKGDSSSNLASLEKLSFAILHAKGTDYLKTHEIVP